MDLKQIAARPDTVPIHQNEAYFVIREYIKEKKGVDIVPEINVKDGQLNAMREIKIMHEMLNYALAYFREKFK